MGTLKRGAANLALLAGSVVATLLLAEVGLHIADFPPRQTSHQRLFVEYDSLLGWRNVPNAEGEYTTEEYSVRLAYNEKGFRGPDWPHARPPGTHRVVVLGDSFVEGYSVELTDRVTEVLQGLLDGSVTGQRVEVIALGTAGYSTDQELILLEREGLRYDPDVVVVMFHPNDIWYNAQPEYWRGFKPRFVERGDSLVLTNVPVPRPRLEDAEAERAARPLGDRLNGWIRRHSKLYWIAARILKNNPRLYAMAVRVGLAGVPPEMVIDQGDELPVPAEFTVYRAEPTPVVDRAWSITEKLLARMDRQVRDSGAHLIVFHIPLRGSIYTDEFAVRERFGLSARGWDVRAVANRLTAVCERNGIDCIDPTERFLEAADTLAARGERLYYKFDWHWNANGHRLAARILAARIVPSLEDQAGNRASTR